MGKSLPDVMGPSQSVSPTLLLEARNLTIDLEGIRARQMWGGHYRLLWDPTCPCAFHIPPQPSFKLELDPGYHAITHI